MITNTNNTWGEKKKNTEYIRTSCKDGLSKWLTKNKLASFYIYESICIMQGLYI